MTATVQATRPGSVRTVREPRGAPPLSEPGAARRRPAITSRDSVLQAADVRGGPLLTVPTAAFAGAAVAVAAVVVLAWLHARRSADRADVAEVLRLGC